MPFKHTTKFQTKDELRAIIKAQESKILELEKRANKFTQCELCYSIHFTRNMDVKKKIGSMKHDLYFCENCPSEEYDHYQDFEDCMEGTFYKPREGCKRLSHVSEWDSMHDWIDIRTCPIYMKSVIIMQKMIRGHNQRWKCPLFTKGFKD